MWVVACALCGRGLWCSWGFVVPWCVSSFSFPFALSSQTNHLVVLCVFCSSRVCSARQAGVPWILRAVSALDRAYAEKGGGRDTTALEGGSSSQPWGSPLTDGVSPRTLRQSEVLGSVSQKRAMVAAALEEYRRKRR